MSHTMTNAFRSGAGLNLGDGMILTNALVQNLQQSVIPTKNENFSFRVPSVQSHEFKYESSREMSHYL